MTRQQTGWALLVGGGLAIVGGLFLPWATLTAPLIGTVSVYGNEGDGQIAAVAGVLGIIAGIMVLNENGGTASKVMAGLGAAGVALIVITDYPNIAESMSDTELGQVGTGMYALIVAGLALVVGAGTLIFQKFDGGGSGKLPKFMDEDEVSRRTRELVETGGLEWKLAWKRVIAQMAAEHEAESTED